MCETHFVCETVAPGFGQAQHDSAISARHKRYVHKHAADAAGDFDAVAAQHYDAAVVIGALVRHFNAPWSERSRFGRGDGKR